jgi:uncharacterized protein
MNGPTDDTEGWTQPESDGPCPDENDALAEEFIKSIAEPMSVSSEFEYWVQEAAKEGNAEALNVLGTWAEDVVLLRKSAAQGYAEGQISLARMYFQGRWVTQDYVEAFFWYEKAALQGDPDAQFICGNMRYEGLGTEVNYVEAAEWYREAAEQGHVEAQAALAGMYYEGKGVLRNYNQAFKWYSKAAEKENAAAQFSLGTIYRDGRGVPQDYVCAHMWLNLCVANLNSPLNNDIAKIRDSVAGKMLPEQIAEAQRLAREWQSKQVK